jgi:hypothetical protein
MSIPGWLLEIFAGVTLVISALSAGQLAVMRAWTRPGRVNADIALSQLLMGIATTGVLVPGLSTLCAARRCSTCSPPLRDPPRTAPAEQRDHEIHENERRIQRH